MDVSRKAASDPVPDPVPALTVVAFQAHIRDRYGPTDSARGIPGTFLWFTEEIGELAHALAQRERGKLDRANLEEEFADCLAWLVTMANTCEVDLEAAIRAKYLTDGGPKGTK